MQRFRTGKCPGADDFHIVRDRIRSARAAIGIENTAAENHRIAGLIVQIGCLRKGILPDRFNTLCQRHIFKHGTAGKCSFSDADAGLRNRHRLKISTALKGAVPDLFDRIRQQDRIRIAIFECSLTDFRDRFAADLRRDLHGMLTGPAEGTNANAAVFCFFRFDHFQRIGRCHFGALGRRAGGCRLGFGLCGRCFFCCFLSICGCFCFPAGILLRRIRHGRRIPRRIIRFRANGQRRHTEQPCRRAEAERALPDAVSFVHACSPFVSET